MTTTSIVIEDEPQKISVQLVGKAYVVTPPKAALAMKMALNAENAQDDPNAMMSMLTEWVMMAFGKSVGRKVLARLDDPEDGLDIVHLTSLMEKVVEAQTGNPTS